jgi:MFS family permease
MTDQKSTAPKIGFPNIIRALKYRNYRLFFMGQGISLIGTWMQRVAVSWLVYRMTDSPFLLGVTAFAGQIPTFLLAPVAGVLIDKHDRMRILIASQVLSMIQALSLATIVLTDVAKVWMIITLSIILGLINAFEITARQSLVIDMIDKREDLGNAIALNSSMFNGARLIGPTVAGVLIATVGEGICFLINGLSFIAVIFSLMAMKIKPRKIEIKETDIIRGLKEGFSYAFKFPPIRSILLILSLVNLMGVQYIVLMPIFARDILHGGPKTLGFLMGAVGMGALFGALFLASKKTVIGLGKWIGLAAAVLGAGLILFSFSKLFWLSLLLLLPVGFGMMVHMASSNTVLQTIVDDDKRGRLMSLYAMSFMGMAPIGNLIGGSLAGKIGAPNTLIIGALFCLLSSLVFLKKLPALRKLIRPIYIKKGIIKDMTVQ